MSGNPRVFHLITRLLKGGAEAKTIQTVLGLDGYEFTIGYGDEFDQGQVRILERNDVTTRRFRSIRHYNPVSTLPAVLAVASYIKKHDFDIVHTHSTEAGIIGRFAASIAGTPGVVHTVHGVPFSTDRNPILNRFVLACERAAARRTDLMVTNADAIADDYLQQGIGRSEQYATVYSGIDVERFRDASPASDIDGDGPRILAVGRLADGKGLLDLLEALTRLDVDDSSVYIVGEGPMRSRLESTIRREGLENTVSLTGYRDDVPAVMRACDLLVLPSYREGTPRVITEAMASGLPVVATDIAGIPEQVEHGTNGFLVAPGDIDALTDRIEQLVSTPGLRDRFGEAARERVGAFSRSQMLSDLGSVYDDLLSE